MTSRRFSSDAGSSRHSRTGSIAANSSVSSTSCSLSSTGSVFQTNGSPEDRAKRIPLGNGDRQKFLFSRLGPLVDKDAKDRWGRRKLGIRIPEQDMKVVEHKFMKPEELARVNPDEVVYYCGPKQLLYSKETFKNKKAKAKATKSSTPPGNVQSTTVVDHPPKHAYIRHTYSVCRCLHGGRMAILQVELKAAMDAVLPHGTWDKEDDWLSPDWASDIRIRDLSTGQKKPLDHPLNGGFTKRGQKLWYSPEMNQYFTQQYVAANLRTEAEYKHFLANPPKVHSHH